MLIELLHMHSVYLGLNAHWIDAHAESLPGRTYMRIELIRMRSVYLVIHICALNWCAWVVFTWASRRIKLMRMRIAQCWPGRKWTLNWCACAVFTWAHRFSSGRGTPCGVWCQDTGAAIHTRMTDLLLGYLYNSSRIWLSGIIIHTFNDQAV